MAEFLRSQVVGITLTFLFYIIGVKIYQKTKFPLFSPLIISTLFLIGYIQLLGIELSGFLTDLSGIQLFLGPLVVSLAIPIVKKMDLIKRNFIPIIVGSIVGALVSMGSILILGPLLGLEMDMVYSIVPKQSTTPIAVEVSDLLGGIRPIAVVVVLLTAVIGVVLIPPIAKRLKLNDPVVLGMSLGATAHAMGTAKALEIDPEAGAIAGIALVFSGIATAIIALFL
jgi:putative effector of murein hydrolase